MRGEGGGHGEGRLQQRSRGSRLGGSGDQGSFTPEVKEPRGRVARRRREGEDQANPGTTGRRRKEKKVRG